MSTAGQFPINAASPEGLFRFEVGDVVGVPHDPVDGAADYEFLSDDTIRAIIAQYPDRNTAKSHALMSMATQLIVSAQDIQVDDIRIRTVERARIMLDLATTFGATADAAGASDAFSVVPLQSNTGYWPRTPQGIPYHNVGESGF